MTQTNQWGTDETTDTQWGEPEPSGANDWGDDTPDAPQWGVADDQATQQWTVPEDDASTSWGDESASSATTQWDVVDQDTTQQWSVPEDPTTAWSATSPIEDNYAAASRAQEQQGSYDFASDESPLAGFPAQPDEPEGERKLPIKLIAIIGAALVAVVVMVVAVGGWALLGGGDDDPEPEPTATSEAANPELAQFEPFAEALETALNERDAAAYHGLLSAESQEVLSAEDMEATVKALPAGAQYEVQLVNGSASGPTATVKLILVRNIAGDVKETPMTSQLVKEGEDWKMVVATDDQ